VTELPGKYATSTLHAISLNRFISTVHNEDYFLFKDFCRCARRTFHGVRNGINLLDTPWYRLLRRSVILSTLISAGHVNAIALHSLHADHDFVLYTWWWRPYSAIPVTACHSTPHLALLVAHKSAHYLIPLPVANADPEITCRGKVQNAFFYTSPSNKLRFNHPALSEVIIIIIKTSILLITYNHYLPKKLIKSKILTWCMLLIWNESPLFCWLTFFSNKAVKIDSFLVPCN